MKLGIVSALLALGGSFSIAHASLPPQSSLHPDYETFATRVLADLRVDQTERTHSVRVRNCANDLNQLKLRIADAPLKVSGAGVRYTDGTSETKSLRHTFSEGYDSPWIDMDNLRREGKCVKSVFVNASSTDPRTQSHVTIFGR